MLSFCAFLALAAADVALPTSSTLPALQAGNVPLNPLILVLDPFVENVQLVDDGAAIVPTTSVTGSDPNFNPLRRILPGELLRPQTRYRVIAPDASLADLADFTTGDVADDETPVDVELAFDAGILSVDASEDIAVADVRIDQGASQLLVLDNGSGDLSSVVSGEVVLSVVALDFAGNAAVPAEIAVKGGCGAAPATSWLPLLAGLLLLRRRLPQ